MWKLLFILIFTFNLNTKAKDLFFNSDINSDYISQAAFEAIANFSYDPKI